jgi:CRISPR-associated protein Cas1
MSFHVLHVFQHGATMAKEQGFIVCRAQDGGERRLPHEDIRAVIIASRGVTLTSRFISAILESDGIILHCDERYQPCGVTSALDRVIDRKAFLRQVSCPAGLNARLWQKMLRGKTENQIAVLKYLGLSCPALDVALRTGQIDEGNAARKYWRLYFPVIGFSKMGRDRKDDALPNQMLNYGYAVLAALAHRSLIIHGLLPTLGVQHTSRYRSTPLVFDIMEPFRPVVDQLLAQFTKQPAGDMKAWTKHIGTALREHRLAHNRYSLKLMDAIDACASSLARAYAENSATRFWTPKL